MITYKLEHIFSYTGTLASPPEIIGTMPEGTRVNFYSTGCEIAGPRIRGKIPPVGGDWMTVRKDGVAVLDVRTTFETHDGAFILMTYQGCGRSRRRRSRQVPPGRPAASRAAPGSRHVFSPAMPNIFG